MTSLKKTFFLSLGSAICLSLMAFFTKKAPDTLSALSLVFYRFLVTSIYNIIQLCMIRVHQGKMKIYTDNILLHVVRSICACSAILFFFLSIKNGSLMVATALSMTHPIFSTILKKKKKLLFFVVCAFIGMILLMQSSGGVTASLACIKYGALAGFCTSLSILSINRISETEPPSSLVFYFALSSLIVSFLLLRIYDISLKVNHVELKYLIIVGLSGALYQDLFMRAIACGFVILPSIVLYFSLVINLIFDKLEFGIYFSHLHVLGVILIVCSTTFIAIKNYE